MKAPAGAMKMRAVRTSVAVSASTIAHREAELMLAIDKYETLLAVTQTRNPDFAFLEPATLVLQLAECHLCLSQLKRAAWTHTRQRDDEAPRLAQRFVDPAAHDGGEASFDSGSAALQCPSAEDVQALLLKTRALYQRPEVAKSRAAVQGEAQVLLQLGQLQAANNQKLQAIATFSDAVRLCYSVADEATESILTNKLQALQLELDAVALLDKLQAAPVESDSEKQLLHAAFTQRAVEGVASEPAQSGDLTREQFKAFAADIGTQPALSDAELDEIWSQIHTHAARAASPRATGAAAKTTTVSFAAFWRWWTLERMVAFLDTRRKSQQPQ